MKRKSFHIVLGLIGIALIGMLFVGIRSYHSSISTQDSINFIDVTLIILFILTGLLLWHTIIQRRKVFHLDNEKNIAEIKLHKEKSQFAFIFEHTDNCVGLLNLDGFFIQVNKPLCHIFGYSESEMLYMNYFYMISRDDLNRMQVSIHELIQGKIRVHDSEHECYKKNGEIVWIKSTLSLIQDYVGNPGYYIIQLQNITTQKTAEGKLHHMAYHDALTGLANRNKLEQFINHLLAVAKRTQQCFALMFLDLDGFKNINDTIGHDVGDMILQVISDRLHHAVRTTDMVARLGGDEFVLLITDVKKAEDVAVIAQKILDCLLQEIMIKSHEIYITTSIGISIYPNDGDDYDTLMKNADLALYRAKEKGRNNYQFYTQEMTVRAQEKLVLKKALRHAIATNEFLLYYQPKMDTRSRRITGIEALLRWKTNEFNKITPDEIIALAEETGLIIPVSDWILRTACKQLKKWHDAGFTTLTMAINCTSRQFKQSTFIDDILAVITEMGIPPFLLEIEITESMIMRDPDNMFRILDTLKQLGVKIVIDDFGTGYWSVGNLKRLSVDKIKIDRTFINQVPKDIISADITRAMIAMINKLGIISVAEGVETQEQFDFLVSEGCREVQGYYLSRPIPEDLMTEFLKNPVPAATSEHSEWMA